MLPTVDLGGLDAGVAGDRQPNDRVGPYRLIRLLGEGGMAEVWLAQRADGTLKREIALKLPKLRRNRQYLATRFAGERDILAGLEHPNIARLYDAGVTPDGLPYLAMEYVRGETLTRWSDAHRLGIRERLALMLQVLDAVQYAHDRQVIHRDIKPSNILMTATGDVRLLDFGVARFLTQDESQLTRIHGRALTPHYASPELARGDPPVPACDVYSLGVLLYELLTGCPPYALKSITSAAQLEQAIVAADVRPPSAQVTPEAAAARGGTPEALARQLRGELDAIVLKALAKTPSERYGSALGLADELRRHLEGRPVAARPDRVMYRLRKWVQRHPSVSATCMGAAVVVGMVLAHEWRAHPAAVPLAATSASRPVVAPPAPPDKSIAVLAFADLSEKGDQEYFADGIAEELINHLSHSPGLLVIARTSSFQFKGKNADARSIAGKLGVAHLLEGSVRKAGDKLRITTQLIRASDGAQLWSESYDRQLADIFRVQDEISDRVAKALDATLDLADRPSGKLPDVAAYNLVLEGNFYKSRRTKDSVEKAIQLYRQAIDLQPDYALAWARLASGYFILEEASGTASPADNARILAALDRSISLDPNLVWAYYTRAGFEMNITWDWAAAAADHQRMREIDPGNTYLLPGALGDVALYSGHFDEALKQYGLLVERNPLDPWALQRMGIALCAADRLPDCLQYRLKLQQLHPDFGGVSSFVGLARLRLGQLPEALDAMRKESKLEARLAGLAMVYAAMGRRGESDAALRTLEKGFPTDAAYEIAQTHAFRGEKDAAIGWLQRSFRLHNCQIPAIKADPFLRDLREDHRYKSLLVQLKMPE